MSDTTAVYAGIVKHERNSDGDLVVYGRATGPDLDLDQQICDRDWLRTAMPQWLASGGNVREQHSSIAAGVGQELTETADGGWDLKALIVDPTSARKVEKGVLKGYSIGIRNPVVVKDAAARGGRIVGGSVVETSLVDRPANPTCQLVLAKAAKPGMTVAPGDLDVDRMLVKVEELHEAPDTVLKVIDAKSAEPDTRKRDYSDKQRDAAASSGAAMKDGSFPIKNVADLKNAIQAVGRAKNPDAARAHIKRRAHALGKDSLIPDSWKSTDGELVKVAPDGMWVHDPAQLAQIRNGLVAVMKAELDELDGGDHELSDVSDLLCSLSLFLAWWDHEAMAGETTSPYTGDDSTFGGPLMAVNLSAQPDTQNDAPADVEALAKAAGQRAEAAVRAGGSVEIKTGTTVEKASEPTFVEVTGGEGGNTPAPDVTETVKAAVAAAVAPLVEQLAKHAAPQTPADDATQSAETEQKTPDLTELVKATVAEAITPLKEQVAKALAQPAPGGPVLTRTREDTQKADANEALLTKAAHYDRLAREVSDRDMAAGYRQLAAEARAEATH